MVQFSHSYITTGKTIALALWTFIGKVMSLLSNTPPRFVIAFLSRSKCLLISWLQSPSAEILEPKKIKSLTVSIFSPTICHRVMGPNTMILVYSVLYFKPSFSLCSLSRGSLVPLCFLPLEWCHLHVCAQSLQLCPTLCDPVACQAPLSMGFSRHEYWSGLLCPPPGIICISEIIDISPGNLDSGL